MIYFHDLLLRQKYRRWCVKVSGIEQGLFSSHFESRRGLSRFSLQLNVLVVFPSALVSFLMGRPWGVKTGVS